MEALLKGHVLDIPGTQFLRGMHLVVSGLNTLSTRPLHAPCSVVWTMGIHHHFLKS